MIKGKFRNQQSTSSQKPNASSKDRQTLLSSSFAIYDNYEAINNELFS